ncbi:MAG TPA: 3-phosphoshikimate 1-carboxyvinyltransferase [Methylomirabilota bacterium]|jgi:3-phosphoshikimate 1-carboxyvinyltransferase|nr:3-phosphoshikimate 1-carboxyvinyltransferase [Methylomirabilota bacterium]
MTDEARRAPARPIEPITRPFEAVVTLPGSKSYSNRALLVAALARGRSEIIEALHSDDTRYMARALTLLGAGVRSDEAARAFTVEGVDGRFPAREATLEIGNAGTAARFLTAAVALGQGIFVIDGSPAMRKRPIQPLLDGLRGLGAEAESREGTGCPPVVVRAHGLAGGHTRMRGDISSQYFSAILMAAPYARRDVEIEVEGELVSAPYVTMTLSTMAAFGVRAERDGDRTFRVPAGQRYQARRYAVEPDASGASYFFAAAAVTGGRVVVPRLGTDSAQGDLGLLEVLSRMGCEVTKTTDTVTVRGPARLRAVDADFTRMGDVATTLMAIAPFADGPVTVRGIAQTHYEESDRPVAAATELRRMGLTVESSWDAVTIHPGVPRPTEVQTYDDHRMAMSFAITGLRAPGLRIADPGCVSKTFPEFFEVLERLGRS